MEFLPISKAAAGVSRQGSKTTQTTRNYAQSLETEIRPYAPALRVGLVGNRCHRVVWTGQVGRLWGWLVRVTKNTLEKGEKRRNFKGTNPYTILEISRIGLLISILDDFVVEHIFERIWRT